jgi:hypothetical protein
MNGMPSDMSEALADWSDTGHCEDCHVRMCACHTGRGAPWFTHLAQVSGIIAASLLYDITRPRVTLLCSCMRCGGEVVPGPPRERASCPATPVDRRVRTCIALFVSALLAELSTFPVWAGRMAPAQPASASCFGKACVHWSSRHMTYVMCRAVCRLKGSTACYPRMLQAVKCARHALTKR